MEKVQKKLETGLAGHWVSDNQLTRAFDSSVINSVDSFVQSIQEEIEQIENDKSTGTASVNMDLGNYHLKNYNSKFNIISGREYSNSTQKWIGYVDEITDESFKAKLVDKSSRGTDEYVEFDLDEVSPDDLSLLKENAIFYWSIGFEMDKGQRKSESILKFKRTVISDNNYYGEGFDIGDDLFDGLDWEE